MELNKLPFFRLYWFKTSRQYLPLIDYLEENATIDSAIAKLEEAVNMYPPGQRFFIELSDKKNSNGDRIKKLEFVNSDESIIPTKNQNMIGYGFSGLGALDHPFVLGQINSIEAEKKKIEEVKDQVRDEKMHLMIEKKDLEREKRDFEEKKKETIAQLKQLQEKYQSNTEAAKNGWSIFLGELLKKFNENAEGKGLLGLIASPEEKTEEEKTPEYEFIEKLAERIYNHKLNIDQLHKLGGIVENYLRTIKSNES